MSRLRLALAPLAALALGACGGDRTGPQAAPAPRATPPVALETPPPTYPEPLACDGIGGRVVLAVTIGPDGAPSAIVVRQRSGQPALDEAATAAVRGWKFRPATAGGKPVSTTIQVPVNFTPPQPRPDFCFVLDEQRKRAGGSP
ncbi:MAG TPA: energy transducer TonB [Lysobacter sp.]|nr:energy transducer TonB [Lysobacter sp.]